MATFTALSHAKFQFLVSTLSSMYFIKVTSTLETWGIEQCSVLALAEICCQEFLLGYTSTCKPVEAFVSDSERQKLM